MKIVIVGNGAAGLSAAMAIRQKKSDWDILITARESAPAYSACALPDCLAGWISRPGLSIMDEKAYRDLQIETAFGHEVKALDVKKSEVLLDDRTVEYDQLILATGSRAFVPPIKGSRLVGNFVLKSLSDLDGVIRHKPNRAVVIGSGNIGVETAEALEIQGAEVTIIEMVERIMPKVFDDRPSAILQTVLTEKGIQVLTGEKVTEIAGTVCVEGVITDQRTIPCDTVIWAVGVRQNVELAKEAGLIIGQLGGIEVNSRMETSHDGIYACGDCIQSFSMLTNKPELSLLWPNAKRQGEIAGQNCTGNAVEYEGSFSLVVEEVYEKTCVSMGFIAAMADSPNSMIIEKESTHEYYRLVILDGQIIGFQGIGAIRGLGAIMSLIKTKTPLTEVQRILENPELLKAVPWYRETARYLFPLQREIHEELA